MSFAAIATRRIGNTLARTSSGSTSTVVQTRPILAAQILGAVPSTPSSRTTISTDSIAADSLQAPLKSSLASTASVAAASGASGRASKSVVFADTPHDCIEIPSCFDLDGPHFQYFQDCRLNYDRFRAESKEYQKLAQKLFTYWVYRANFETLSVENQRIVKMDWANFHLTLPEYDDLVGFNDTCNADKAAWMEAQETRAAAAANDLPSNEDHDVEFETEGDGTEGHDTENEVFTGRSKMLKELDCTLDGTYWRATTVDRRTRRKPDTFVPSW